MATARTAPPADRAVAAALVLLVAVVGLRAPSTAAPQPTAPRRCTDFVAGVDPNTAPWWELRSLPGVGPARARHIVAWRQAHPGVPLTCAGDLDAIPGLGPALIERMRHRLVFTTKSP